MAPNHAEIQNHAEALAALSTLQTLDLSILRLSEPISTPHAPPLTSIRSSDISTDAFENTSPASLEADLSHYKELFSKLRFSYLEQVTKEKFLRAIVGDPPLIVEHAENVELEAHLTTTKAELKAQKQDVACLVEELETRGRELSRRHLTTHSQTAHISALPSQISSLQTTLAHLRKSQHLTSTSTSPSPSSHHSLPLPATLSLLSTRASELKTLDSQLHNLQTSLLPQRTREWERAEGELQVLEVQKQGTVQGAREARRMRMREMGGGGGEEGEGEAGVEMEMELELERRGRWLRGCVRVLGEGGMVGT